MSTTSENPTAETPSWNEATAELEAILVQLDAEQPDIDSVAAKVERAAELVSICRKKLRTARFRVDQALETLNEATGEPSTGEPSTGEPTADEDE